MGHIKVPFEMSNLEEHSTYLQLFPLHIYRNFFVLLEYESTITKKKRQ